MAILPNGSQVSINSVNDGVIGPDGDSSACLLSNPNWVQNVVSPEFSGRIDGTHLNGNFCTFVPQVIVFVLLVIGS